MQYNHQIEYTPCYCEENIYNLLKNNISLTQDTYVVFISNRARQIPLWKQSSAPDDDSSTIIWDYHVIALNLNHSTSSSLVYDLDSRLPFPCPLDTYIDQSLKIEVSSLLPEQYQRSYRVIHAAHYLANFSSDRSHMLTHGTGEGTTKVYRMPPPMYPRIVNEKKERNTFQQYVDFDSLSDDDTPLSFDQKKERIRHGNYGAILNEQEFLYHFLHWETK